MNFYCESSSDSDYGLWEMLIYTILWVFDYDNVGQLRKCGNMFEIYVNVFNL